MSDTAERKFQLFGRHRSARPRPRPGASAGPESEDPARVRTFERGYDVRGYRDLKAMELAVQVYALAKLLPKEEQYRLTSQLLGAVASVPANIAEGYQRGTRKDYAHFVSIARGSLAETETFLMLASRSGLISDATVAPSLSAADEISRMHFALRRSLTAPDPAP